MQALNCLGTAVREAVTDLHSQLGARNLQKPLLLSCVRPSRHTWPGLVRAAAEIHSGVGAGP